MRNLERYELGDPADVIDAHRRRDQARKNSEGWREAIRRQQFPEPIYDRYSELADRLLGPKPVKRGA